MKRKIALIMLAAMLFSLVACNSAEVVTTSSEKTAAKTSAPADTTAVSTGSPAKTSVDEKDEVTLLRDGPRPIELGTYKMTYVPTNTTVKYGEKRDLDPNGKYSEFVFNWVTKGDEYFYAFTMFVPETVNKKDNPGVSFTNYEEGANIKITNLKENSEIATTYSAELTDNNALWRIIPNGDGTFSVAPRLSKSMRLIVKDGKMTIVKYSEGDDPDQYRWKFEDVSQDNQFYKEFRSEKGNIVLRVPLTVYDKKHYTSVFSPKTKKMTRFIPTAETLQSFCNTSQEMFEDYIDLTGWRNHNYIVIHAYNFQNVMAGVVGTRFVYVNCGDGEWFFNDLTRMQYRYEVEEVEDWSFMLLHEMGHLFDYDQPWNFEGESNTNIKAAYVLWKHQNDEGRRVVAAQSGYNFGEYFDGETITETWKNGAVQTLSDGRTLGQNVERTCWIFASYNRDEIGWDKVRLAYRYLHKNCKKQPYAYDALVLYTDTIMKYANPDSKTVEEFIGTKEWNAICTKCKDQDGYTEPTATPTPTGK